MKTTMLNIVRSGSNLRFIFKLFTFLMVFLFLDRSIGSLFRYYYFKQNTGFIYRTTYAIEETKADVLIFGTSKANHQYNPDIFEKRMSLSCYNVGREGSSIFYHYAILKAVLKRYTPKLVILDISRDFEKKEESYDRLSMLLPYYRTHPEMQSIIGLKSPYEKFKLTSYIYPYNSLLFSIIIGNLDVNKSRYKELKGFAPVSKIYKGKIQTYRTTDYEIDTLKLAVYESFIKECNRSKIELYIVASPDFIDRLNDEKSNVIGAEIAKRYNVPFFDYSTDTLFLQNAQYFFDYSHLNENGAKVFSNLIIDKILGITHSRGDMKAQRNLLVDCKNK